MFINNRFFVYHKNMLKLKLTNRDCIFPPLMLNIPPTLLFALCVCFGVLSKSLCDPLVFTVIAAIFMLLCVYIFLKNKGFFITAFTSFVLFCSAATSIWMQNKKIEIFQKLHNDKKVIIFGQVNNIDKNPHKFFKYISRLQLKTIRSGKNLYNTNEQVLLYSTKKPPAEVSDSVIFYSAKITTPKNNSFKKYLIKEGLSGVIFSGRPALKTIERPSSISKILWQLKNHTYSKLKKKLSHNTFALLSSIFLGNKYVDPSFFRNIKSSFLLWGTSHHHARSGLHLIIFLVIWHFIFSILPISHKQREVLLFCFCLLYFNLSWTSTSFMRAFFVFAIYKVCSFFNLPTNILHILSLITIITILLNPALLFFLDFQLSFALSLALAWLNHKK